jgi:predicted ATPase/transcriptional regulator with XRE-family HTH domain
MSDIISLGLWIKRRRKALDLTQHALAALVGCSKELIVKIEGDARRPSREIATLLATHLQLAADERVRFIQVARAELGADRLAPPAETVVRGAFMPAQAVSSTVDTSRHRGSTRPNNLPTPPTALIGRETELAQLAERLEARDCRLLTLIGTGGIGKTRLAMQVAADLGNSFPDGVAFVALAPLRSVEFVIPAIADALSFTFNGLANPKAQLFTYLRKKDILLVLDNIEHLLTVAPLVSELLANCPNLTVLATGRAPLHVRGEQQFPVPPLRLPDLAYLPDFGRLTQYAAVALFVACTQAVQPTFQVTSATALTVATICVQLDGLPLAIELAAARIKLFSPEELLARLSGQLTLLTGGAHDLPARQQTIRATIDWSYNLLSDAEQQLFRRLGVFVGGCTLDAAEAVCHNSWPGRYSGEATEREHPTSVSVLEGLAALIDKNLVQQAAESSGDTRFEMLETIHEYALEHLAASDELEVLRQRHAEYFLALAETAAPEVVGAQGQLWMNRLATEYSNLRMVLAWSIPPQGQVDLGMRLTVALLWFWIIRNHWGEGYVWLTRAAVLARQIAIAPAVQANVLRAAGIIAQFRAEYLQAIAQLEESLSLSRRVGKRTEVAEALLFLGWIARERGDYARAEALEVEALALYQAEQHNWGYCLTLLSLGETALDCGDLVQATARCEDLRVLCGDSGQLILQSRAMLRLGRIAYLRGEYDHAQNLLEECRSLFQQARAPSAVAEAQFELGRVARAQGDGLAAAQQLTASLVGYREYWGNKREIASCLEELAGLAATMQHPMRAARLFGAAEVLRVSVGTPLPPVHRADYARDVALVRANMDEHAFAAAWAAGRAMTLEQAIACALGEHAGITQM